ncbi:MAG: thiamine pyrophosphate-binding protein, partial [Polyangiaceae bacterium]
MAFVHGGRLVAQALKRHGVSHLFTLCGGHIQAIYDGCIDEKIRVIDVRHEQTAGHAADGYARVTGKPGVCAVTAGPGVTDVVTAVANAQRAGIPMIVIGGAGPKILCDMGSLQDMDSVTLMRPITKWSVQVPQADRIAEYIDSAFRIAQANVPGPVFLEMPLDLLMNGADDAALPATAPLENPPRPAGDKNSIARASEILKNAKRPVFIVGSQIRWSPNREAVKAAADAFQAPFYLNGMARGAIPQAHAGLMSRSRKFALAQADAVFMFGTPFDFRVDYGRSPTWAADAKIVQIDLDGAELGRNRKVELAIHGDSGLVLQQLIDSVGKKDDAKEWLDVVRAQETKQQSKMLAEKDSDASPPNPLRVCNEIGKRLGKNDIVVGDGGDFVATAAYVLKMEWPQLWMDPGPLGTLGVGVSFAMASKFAEPDKEVVCLFGDGTFGMTGWDMQTAMRFGLPFIGIIGNNSYMNQIRAGQIMKYGKEKGDIGNYLGDVNFEDFAKMLG